MSRSGSCYVELLTSINTNPLPTRVVAPTSTLHVVGKAVPYIEQLLVIVARYPLSAIQKHILCYILVSIASSLPLSTPDD